MLFYNKDLTKVLGKWCSFLPDTTLDLADNIYNRVKELRINTDIYPEQNNIFKVFKSISPNEVKVVILGQDPYHNENATGVAFACKLNPSPSFKQIWNSIKKDTNKEYEGKITLELTHLLEQGVFLINTILTVEKNSPLSHKYLRWEFFTASVINELNKNRNNLVFMLWGSYAKKYQKYIDGNKHLILTDTHPQYANYQNKQWDCKHFSKCNKYFKEHNIEPIKWR